MVSKRTAALAALALSFANAAAAAPPPAPPGLVHAAERVGAGLDEASGFRRGGVGLYLLGAVAIGLLVLAGFALFGEDPDSMPASP